MDQQPIMVSVIMLCYNHERYIRQALESILSQNTSFSYEIIVHDDASTDNSAGIIREFEEKYPHILRPVYQTENQYRRKVGIRRTFVDPLLRGKYIAFCEGDDYWTDRNKLQKQVDFLEEHPEYSAVTHNCSFVDRDGNPTENIYPVYRLSRSHRFTLDRLAMDVVYPGQTATLVCRREDYIFRSQEASDAFHSIRISTGDKKLYLKLLLEKDMYVLEDVMSAYRIVTAGGDSWSAKTAGQNRSFALHAASIDFRRFARKYYHRSFPNYYATFHTGIAALVKVLRSPSPENRKVWDSTCREHGGLIPTLFYLAGLGIVSIPLYFRMNREKRRFDLKG